MCSARSSLNRTCAGPPGAAGHLMGAGSVAGHREVRTADPRHAGSVHSKREVIRPFGLRVRVAVEVGDEVAARGLQPHVARDGEPPMRNLNEPRSIVAGDDCARLVRGSVIDDDHFEVRVLERAGMAQALVERARGVVRADDDRDRRPVELEVGNRAAFARCAAASAGLRAAIFPREAEVPTFDRRAADPPVIRPREEARTGDAPFEGRVELLADETRLGTFALAARAYVMADLAENERPLAREMVESRDVATQVGLIGEIDVERREVECREREELGRRKVGVGHQLGSVLRADDIFQPRM